MNELSLAAQAVEAFLRETIQTVRLDLRFTITVQPGARHPLAVSFSGPDLPLLLQADGELMRALRHFSTIISGLDETYPEPVEFLVALAEDDAV